MVLKCMKHSVAEWSVYGNPYRFSDRALSHSTSCQEAKTKQRWTEETRLTRPWWTYFLQHRREAGKNSYNWRGREWHGIDSRHKKLMRKRTFLAIRALPPLIRIDEVIRDFHHTYSVLRFQQSVCWNVTRDEMFSSLDRDLQALKSTFSSIKYVAFHFIWHRRDFWDILLMQDCGQVATNEVVEKFSQLLWTSLMNQHQTRHIHEF